MANHFRNGSRVKPRTRKATQLHYISGYNPSLSYPWKYGPASDPPIRNLRLACRTFYTLLAPSIPLHCFVTYTHTFIPSRTKALYITPTEDAKSDLRRLLAKPDICCQLVTLDLPCHQPFLSSPPFLFDILCQNSQLFPRVRNLTLDLLPRVYNTLSILRFWERLNQGFPQLICLVLRGDVRSECDSGAIVVFKQLKILDFDYSKPSTNNVRFPKLRHVSLGKIKRRRTWSPPWARTMFPCPPLTESLLVREVEQQWRVDWEELPRLQFLGVPIRAIDAFWPLPRGHPLKHLYVVVVTGPRGDQEFWDKIIQKDKGIEWVQRVSTLSPNVKKITVVFKMAYRRLDDTWGRFDEDALARIGWFTHSPVSHTDGRRQVLERHSPVSEVIG